MAESYQEKINIKKYCMENPNFYLLKIIMNFEENFLEYFSTIPKEKISQKIIKKMVKKFCKENRIFFLDHILQNFDFEDEWILYCTSVDAIKIFEKYSKESLDNYVDIFFWIAFKEGMIDILEYLILIFEFTDENIQCIFMEYGFLRKNELSIYRSYYDQNDSEIITNRTVYDSAVAKNIDAFEKILTNFPNAFDKVNNWTIPCHNIGIASKLAFYGYMDKINPFIFVESIEGQEFLSKYFRDMKLEDFVVFFNPMTYQDIISILKVIFYSGIKFPQSIIGKIEYVRYGDDSEFVEKCLNLINS